MRKRRRNKFNNGLITLLSIGTVMISSIFGNNIVQALETNPKTDVINICNKGSITFDIENEHLKEKLQKAVNEILEEENIKEKKEIHNLLNGNTEIEISLKESAPVTANITTSAINKINDEIERIEIAKNIADLDKKREEEITRKKAEEERKRKEILERKKRETKAVTRGTRTTSRHLGTFRATAYDLTVSSQGKWGDKVASGKIKLSGHSRQSARCIAVDPSIIPLGSIVKVTVPSMPEYSGEYIAYDTGGAIRGNRIDIFVGDFEGMNKEARRFGRRDVYIEIVGRAW